LGQLNDLHGDKVTHTFTLRVYYEDTDLAGIVYYANYLKFIERARTEWVRAAGIDQTRLKDEQGIVFAVSRVEADYLSPARFDDVAVIQTTVTEATGARLTLRQDVTRDGTLLFTALVTLVALTTAGRPARLPAEMRRLVAATPR
jgi:acyl-CoA thioester hydrolase